MSGSESFQARRQNSELLSVLKAAPVGIGTVMERVIQRVNPRLCSMTGYEESELIGKSVKMLYESEAEFERVGREKYHAIHSDGWGAAETRWMRKDGSVMDVIVSSAVIEPGRPERGITFIVLDISEWKRAEAELRVQNARWRELFYGAPEGIVLLDNDLCVVFMNAEFTRIFGYSEDELLGVPTPSVLIPDDKRGEGEQAVESLRRGEVVRIEQTVRVAKDGRRVPVSVLSKPIKLDEDRIGVYGIYRDITELNNAQRVLRQSLHEKEVLLQEIHHRVKNNLNIVSSLLALQAAEHPDPQLGSQIQQAQTRVQSMAMIHERIYRAGSFERIALHSYLEDLVREATRAYLETDRIRFNLRLDEVHLRLSIAVPCGLLVNEIIVNSLQHAFPEGRAGTVTLELTAVASAAAAGGGGEARLRIADDGVGMKTEAPGESSEGAGIGMELIRELADQVGGVLRRELGPGGTAYELTIPISAE